MKQQTSFLSYVPAIVRARVFATRAQDAPYVKEAVLPDAASISPPARSGGTRVIADGPPCLSRRLRRRTGPKHSKMDSGGLQKALRDKPRAAKSFERGG